ncbi:hypothetical protein GR702_11615 [Novosphingobium sp. FGD1]|uniref:Phage gp6-like head-tail connector protein n=1 Tax=Novosphingobium silvae TaxID=2692619 RepID=A0A7X4GGV3_9SPHN|nr:head-tail connector protein [Novosphingobium silvae]MYL98411.1 hypothetical protein [Novosphingobium silvae]
MDWTRLKLIAAPTAPVVTLDEARDHLRISHDLDDTYIEHLIATATAVIEGPTGAGISLAPARWQLTMDHLPRHFDIDLCPVMSVDKITLNGENVPPLSYRCDLDSVPARVHVAFPSVRHDLGSVKVEFTAGNETVPSDLRHALLMLISHFYEQREAFAASDLKEVPFAVGAIISRYRAF